MSKIFSQPWKASTWTTEDEVAPKESRTMEIVNRMTARRRLSKPPAYLDEDDKEQDLAMMIFKMDRELKSQMADMDRKLDKISSLVHSGRSAVGAQPRIQRRGSTNSLVAMTSSMQMQPNLQASPAPSSAFMSSAPPPTRDYSGGLSGEGRQQSQQSHRSDDAYGKEGSAKSGLPAVLNIFPVPNIPTQVNSGTPHSGGCARPGASLLFVPNNTTTPPARDNSGRGSETVDRGPSGNSTNISARLQVNIEDLVRSKIVGNRELRSRTCLKIWQFLEEPESSRAALWFSRLMLGLVLGNVSLALFQAQENPLMHGNLPHWIHLFFDIVCTVEIVTLFLVCPNRWMFFTEVFNWVDIFSALGLILRVIRLCSSVQDPVGHAVDEALHCVVPVIWLLKLLRNFEKFHLLLSAFQMAFEALPVLLFALAIMVLSFAALIFFVEPRENMAALSKSVWFTVVTMMTVGYGDLVPVSAPGNIIATALMVTSQLYMAIPLGIVGGSFSRVWEERDRLLLIRRTRKRLLQWGYTPQDLLELFLFYDTLQTGELNIQDFSRMMSDMKLGLNAERVQRLFKNLDSDNSGMIDDREFLGAIFPSCGLYDLGFRASWKEPWGEPPEEGACVKVTMTNSKDWAPRDSHIPDTLS